MTEQTALTKDWYKEIEAQAASNFINLPIEFQLQGYDYNYISKGYLKFFVNPHNSRKDKLILARKFLSFTRKINKNRARTELGEDYFKCFHYFMENFPSLLEKQDIIALSALEIITDSIDKSQFIEDVISLDELRTRTERLVETREREEIIDAEWEQIERQYELVNSQKKAICE